MNYITHNRHLSAKQVIEADIDRRTATDITFSITTDDGITVKLTFPVDDSLLTLAKYLSDVIDSTEDVGDLTIQFGDQYYTMMYAIQLLMGVFLLDVLIEEGIDITTPSSSNGRMN